MEPFSLGHFSVSLASNWNPGVEERPIFTVKVLVVLVFIAARITAIVRSWYGNFFDKDSPFPGRFFVGHLPICFFWFTIQTIVVASKTRLIMGARLTKKHLCRWFFPKLSSVFAVCEKNFTNCDATLIRRF